MNRTKDELLQSCIEQFEHIDLTNENKTLATTKSLVMEIKKALAIPVVSERLPLDEINKKAKTWAKERSVGKKKQDQECEYDYKCGMLTARSILLNAR